MRSASIYVAFVMVVFGKARGTAGNDSTTTPAATVTSSSPPASTTAPASSPADKLPLSLLLQARRASGRKGRSTSSSSREKEKSKKEGASENNKESLGLTVSSKDSSESDKGKDKIKKYMPKSSAERKGWRKWHRKCAPCPELRTPWRHPSVQWICGGYQRARRSFKSTCMMRYRNCQDGTMFVLIHRHRCEPGQDKERPFGNHFFYDYKVAISGDSSDTSASETASASRSSSSS